MKYSIEDVKKYFEDHGCELLSTEYKRNDILLDYSCNCGNISKIYFSSFQRGQRCMKCCKSAKLTYQYVYDYFKNAGCKLLETEYINSRTRMKYRCKCNNISLIKFSSFRNGSRCKFCAGKYTFEQVKLYFEEHDCELLSEIYDNNNELLDYICKCNNIAKISFRSFKNGHRCMSCSGNNKFTIDYCKDYFAHHGCKLIESDYIGTHTLMEYICSCGNLSKITFNSFKYGVRCKDCGYDKSSKSSRKFKDYIFPSGDIRRIQGFEHYALNELIKQYSEDDIITDRRFMPEILYFNKKLRRYYPDIYIKSINKIIEIKSTYTYKADIITNIIKALATRKFGFSFEFWIYKDEQNKMVV